MLRCRHRALMSGCTGRPVCIPVRWMYNFVMGVASGMPADLGIAADPFEASIAGSGIWQVHCDRAGGEIWPACISAVSPISAVTCAPDWKILFYQPALELQGDIERGS